MSRTPGQVAGAAITGAVIGVLGGAALGGALRTGGAVPGAAIGATLGAGLSGWADAKRQQGRPQPLLVRIVLAALIAAALGSVMQWLLPEWSAALPGAIVGAATGLIGGRPTKAVLGAGVGFVVGLAFDAWAPTVGWAAVTSATVVLYRSLAAVVWRGREQLRVRAEQLSPEQVRFVVPFAEASGYVGVDYLQRYAESVGARFERSPRDVGIVASFDDLAGSRFDPSLVHPLVREFYEHTSRFHLTIVPEWKWWMRLPYRIYRKTVAKPLGQANAPFEIEEVQRGVVSWIDTIDVDLDGTPDVRAWVRAYEGSGDPLYIGIYTVRQIDGTAYVSVGFPLPSGNFTATLLPVNHRGDGLLLTADVDDTMAGHYLSLIAESGELTTLQLTTFGEEIEVFVEEGMLRTEQTFSLGGFTFLTLHFEIGRAQPTTDLTR